MNEFIVLDTETTGLDAREHKLVEIAAVRYRGEHALEFFQTLINPGQPIPPAASSTHHITDSMVAKSPSWDEISHAFLSFVGDVPIVAHNAGFDRSFLDELQNHTWLCNYRLSRHLWPEAPSHANQALRYWLGIDIEADKAHRALDDARVTAAIFKRGLHILKQNKVSLSPESIQSYINALIPVTTMPHGKHRGIPLNQLPDSYLNWALENMLDDPDLRGFTPNGTPTTRQPTALILKSYSRKTRCLNIRSIYISIQAPRQFRHELRRSKMSSNI